MIDAETAFTESTKPDLGEIDSYFTSRLEGQDQGVVKTKDALGNNVYTSQGHTEQTLFGSHPSTLIASPEGQSIAIANSGLLRKIATGAAIGNELSSGREGKVYKIKIETPAGPKDYVLKYYFPVKREREKDILYTPGVDQMRWMQLVQMEMPLPGLRLATPVLATLDMTLAPYVEESIPYEDQDDAFFRESDEGVARLAISDKSKELLRRIKAYDKTQLYYQQFLSEFESDTRRVTRGLTEWTQKKSISGTPFPMISKTFSTVETENPFNLVISIKDLGMLFEECVFNPSLLAPATYDDDVFLPKVRSCCSLVEFSVGSRKIEAK